MVKRRGALEYLANDSGWTAITRKAHKASSTWFKSVSMDSDHGIILKTASAARKIVVASYKAGMKAGLKAGKKAGL